MSTDNYKKAMRYEMFIRNTYNCKRGSRNGADISFMKNAMSMEKGETFAKHLGSFEKQFNKVKNYVEKALIKLTKTKPFSNEKDFFNNLLSKLEYVNSTHYLMEIVDVALDKINEINPK